MPYAPLRGYAPPPRLASGRGPGQRAVRNVAIYLRPYSDNVEQVFIPGLFPHDCSFAASVATQHTLRFSLSSPTPTRSSPPACRAILSQGGRETGPPGENGRGCLSGVVS